MARPAPASPPAGDIRALIDGEGRLAVRVTPGARVEEVAIEAGRVAVRVRAKPEDGKATEAVRQLLARALGIAPSQLACCAAQLRVKSSSGWNRSSLAFQVRRAISHPPRVRRAPTATAMPRHATPMPR